MLTRLILGEPSPRDDAEAAWREYLQRNVVASETLRSMREAIHAFQRYAPRLFASKCIDGRVHGSDGKGYPPTSVVFSRTDGNRVELTPENMYFWNRVNSVVLAARRQTPDTPALFIALAHGAKLGGGCAAHNEDEEAAVAAVAEQATALRTRYRPNDLYVVHGFTNTDDGAERIVFPDGRSLDTESIIDTLDTPSHPLRSPESVFQDRFLSRVLDDPPTDRSVGGRAPAELMAGPMFHELRARIAMEGYFLREITQIVRNQTRNNVVFAPRVFDEVRRTIDAVRGLPEPLHAPLLYQTLWNIASTLHERRLLPTLGDTERHRRLDHAEERVGYGEGFEMEHRNRLVLAKPGRGDDRKALEVARRVLHNNRTLRPQSHPPLVHVNLELAGDWESWGAFNHDVLAPLLTRVDNVRAVFGDDCRILVSYSRHREKCFYPVKFDGNGRGEGADPRLSFPIDVTRGLAESDFERERIALREQVYRQAMALEAESDE